MATEEQKLFSDFDNIDKTEVTGRGSYFRCGRHLCVARGVTWRKSMKSTAKVWVSEHTVVKSTALPYSILKPDEVAAGLVQDVSKPEPHYEGSQVSWTIDNGKSGYDGRIKQWLMAVKGSVRNAIATGGISEKEVAELKAMWKLDTDNVDSEELRNAVMHKEAVAGWPIWVDVQRTRTVKGGLIDGCNFSPLTSAEITQYGATLWGAPADDIEA